MYLYNYPPETKLHTIPDDYFTLKTCQRLLLIGIKPFTSSNKNMLDQNSAYQFFLEVCSGLQSKLKCEHEIANQVKKALQEYIKNPNRNSKVIKIIEKTLKDSKKIKTEYLKGIANNSYSSIIRKMILQHNSEKVIIIGSGQLAIDCINQLKNKCNLFITARNPNKLKDIEDNFNIPTIKWEDRYNFHNYSIINCVGCETILFDSSFFQDWNKSNIFIDLGNPSSINTPLGKSNNIYRLEDILSSVSSNENKINNKIFRAKEEINKVSIKNYKLLEKKLKI